MWPIFTQGSRRYIHSMVETDELEDYLHSPILWRNTLTLTMSRPLWMIGWSNSTLSASMEFSHN